MAQLAIKGHSTRGKEVIEILEMLGGKNTLDLAGYTPDLYYHIDNNNIITASSLYKVSKFKIFTVEEFYKKFPYKVGDKVTVTGLPEYSKIINFMEWFDGDIHYSFDNETWFLPSALQPYKEEAMDKVNKAIFDANAQCCDIMKETMKEQKKDYEEWFQINYLEFENNDDTWADEVEVNLGKDYELQIRGDKTFIVKKQLQYPKTYAECCRIIVAKQDRHYYYTKKDKEQDYPNEIRILDQLDHLRMLIICRDAYWKITGEQMGLDKLWEPNWSDPDEKKYCIVITTEGDIKKCIQKITHKILTFPTEEMRDAFYENFKSLIEFCKELL